MDGICTLANDRVYNQLVALLNSIEAILGETTPVCVYPYDENTEKIAEEINKRPYVELYRDCNSMDKWDKFAQTIWDSHPTARQAWQKAGSQGYHRFGTHRRYCAFDGPFDRFLYLDADTLIMGDVAAIFERLANNDCVVYDFQYKDPSHVYNLNSSKLTAVFSEERIRKEIFCSGMYASKKDLFTSEQRQWLIEQIKAGDAEILYAMAPDQTIINYLMMKSGFSVYNLALNLPTELRTGCCATSPHFSQRDNILYDRNNRLTYLHYIGLSSNLFNRVCQGENFIFPYRDLFLHYRYLKETEKLPQFNGQAKEYNPTPTLMNKVLKKLGINK